MRIFQKALDSAARSSYIPHSDRRKPVKKSVNLRIPSDTYAIIESAAKANGMSAYALMIKVLVAAASNYKPKEPSR